MASEQQRNVVQSLLKDQPGDYNERYDELLKLSHMVHQEMAKVLTPALNDYAQSRELPDLSSRRTFAAKLNEDLKRLHLAIRCTKTDRPAILIADWRNNRHGDVAALRFRLQVHGEMGNTYKTFTSNEMPEFDLMEDAVRIETLARSIRRPG